MERAITGADRAVGRIFAVLGLGDAVARILGFIATVYVARRLGADVYGVISVAMAIVLYCSHVADFSVEAIGAREIAHRRDAVAEIVPPLIAARLLLALACVIVLSVAGLVFLPQPDGVVLAITSLTLFATASSTRFVFVGMEQPGAAAAARVTGELLFLVLVVLFARDAGDIAKVPLARLIGEGAAVIGLALLLRARGFGLAVRRAPGVARPILAKASPLVAHAILGLVIYNSDLIFLRALRDAATAGMYAAAYTLVSFLLNVGVTYGNSLLPVLTRLAPEPERQRALYHTSMTQALTVALPVAVGGAMLAGGLMQAVFGAKYLAATAALRILIWSIVAAYVRTVTTYTLIAHHQQAFVLRTTVWSAVINLVLNLLLIPRWGMPGAAAATLATEALRTLIGLGYGSRFGFGAGFLPRLWRPLVATAAMALLLWKVEMPNVFAAVAAGVVAYGVVLLMTGGIRVREGRPALTV